MVRASVGSLTNMKVVLTDSFQLQPERHKLGLSGNVNGSEFVVRFSDS